MSSTQVSTVTYRTAESAEDQKAAREKALGECSEVIELIRDIKASAKEPDDRMVQIAMRVRELRRLVEAGGIKWHGWALRNLKIGDTKLCSLHRIAESSDPYAEYKRQLRLGAERSKGFRQRKAEAKPVDEERMALIAWARRASMADVRSILAHIGRKSRPLH